MNILAIDPGNVNSAYCLMDEEYHVIAADKKSNEEVAKVVKQYGWDTEVEIVIEMVACYGMPVGKEVFDTCVWIGRFTEMVKYFRPSYEPKYVYRIEEKKNICHAVTASDANIRRALIDRFAKHDLKNGKGTKGNPDFFFGFKADMWAAFAVGVTYLDNLKYEKLRA